MFDCPECTVATREQCRACEGTGRQIVDRCPGRTIPRIAWDVCRSVALLDVGILPVTGGWQEQSATWAEAMSIVAREKGEYEEKRLKGNG
jgi:hypothetical protein